ncbi:flagellar hook-basal body complex protein [Buchnera aphidicola]|nr:flagellar hook-basal body complex protein [Buchnera aphidicola]
MENSINIAMHAASQLLEKQNVTNNNLANISTTGFKKEYFSFIKNNNLNCKKDELLDSSSTSFYDLTPGSLVYTQEPLDVAIQNDRWFVIQDNLNNKNYYTRNGHFNIDKKRFLNINGKYVIGEKGLINIPKDITLKILNNGDIIAFKKNTQKFKIDRLKTVQMNVNHMIHLKNGFFYIKKRFLNMINNNQKNDTLVKSGVLESSNVNPTTSIIDMITDARLFEMNMKIISHIDEITQMANKILNIND